MSAAAAPPVVRRRIRVRGTVQGVGFRPYVYRLADELRLAGFVLNDSLGVLIEVQGSPDAVETLIARLAREAPPLAAVESIAAEAVAALAGAAGFRIRASPTGGAADVPVSPDTATCDACLRELFDPRDRRYRYPFINCTDCGPRFTIVRGVPYDRPLTTMTGFAMCERCRAEYDDPCDRRFHAQPNACPVCGPQVSLLDPGGAAVTSPTRAIPAAAEALAAGSILAVKGVGGYHLACRADQDDVVARLRARKHREDKPFALMVAALERAEALVELGDEERALVTSVARPIVLAPRQGGAKVAEPVAPGAPELGVMLAYSPLHHILMADLLALGVEAIVLTSGNVSDEPIAFEDDDALARLGGIVELFLVHDRPIETRTDDSVARVVSVSRRRRPAMLRRSRGYVPGELALPVEAVRPVLACGAELKSTFCLARGRRAWVGHHIGDLQNYETLQSFTTGIAHFEELFAVRPEVVAHDLHPDYLSTRYALERAGAELIGVQHHHAHLAACLAEHGLASPAVGAIFDGTGYGSDGTVWGGELLFGDLAGSERVGALLSVPLPGGDRAVREPWRMACAWLNAAGGLAPPAALAAAVGRAAWDRVQSILGSTSFSPPTSSVGRLFDAVSALCGIRVAVNYEGQAAIELEASCDEAEHGRYEIEVAPPALTLDPRAAIRQITADVAAGATAGRIAARFHNGLADATARACALAAAQCGAHQVVLSGGVFANRRLLQGTAARLEAAGLRVLTPERLPAGDGGVAFGQAAVAAAQLAARAEGAQ